MDTKENNLFDVLSSLENEENIEVNTNTEHNPVQADLPLMSEQETIIDDSHLFFTENEVGEDDTSTEEVIEIIQIEEKEKIVVNKKQTPKHTLGGSFIFLIKYLSTSTLIFVVLLFTTNYSAYYNIAMSYMFQGDFQEKSQGLLNSVEAGSIEEEKNQEPKVSLESASQLQEEEFNSIETLAAKAKRAEVDLGITITPYENRIVIPKIGKNIPLIDIEQKTVSGIDELNDIFMKELENGVIRYPGSAKPGEKGNAFVFGHSSNFPWMEGDYNDVFSLLDKVVYDDEIIVYYGQKKYIYKIKTKEVIHPGDVSVLKRNEGKSEISLMTCWPIGTTLNRLILIGELVEIK